MTEREKIAAALVQIVNNTPPVAVTAAINAFGPALDEVEEFLRQDGVDAGWTGAAAVALGMAAMLAHITAITPDGSSEHAQALVDAAFTLCQGLTSVPLPPRPPGPVV